MIKPATEANVEAIEEAARRKYEIDPDESVDLGASDVLALIARIRQEQAENEPLRAEGVGLRKEWFNKGKVSAAHARNASGCVCVFDEDGETILKRCAVHHAEVERLRAALVLSEKALNLVSSEPGPTWCEVDEALDAIAALDIEYPNDEVENE